MNNADQPAFPLHPQIEGGTGLDYLGISKREYFAAHAPNEIPDWFTHTPIGELPKLPSWQDIPDEKDKEAIRSWVCDPCWDLPDELMWFQLKFREVEKEREQWSKDDQAERYFQWRSHYADTILNHLQNNQ